MRYRITDTSVDTVDKGPWSRDEVKPLPPLARRGARTTIAYTLPPLRSKRGWSLSQATRSLPYCLAHYPSAIAEALQAQVMRSQSDANLLFAAGFSVDAGADPLGDLARTLPAREYDWLQVQEELHGGRHLFTFPHCEDKVIRALWQRNVKSATRPDPNGLQVMSPLLVPSLLGGMTFTTFEKMAFKVLEQVVRSPVPMPEQKKRSYLRESALICGFGAHIKHHRKDGVSLQPFQRKLLEPDLTFIRRLKSTHLQPVSKAYTDTGLSAAQQYLVNLPKGEAYAASLVQMGAYGGELSDFLLSFKEEVCREASIALCLEGGDITRAAAARLEAGLKTRKFEDCVAVTEAVWLHAVRTVFTTQWKDLNLESAAEGIELGHDTVKVVARLIISKMSKRLRMGAEPPKLPGQLVAAMALLTGIPVVAFLRFIELDFYRRGECIMSSQGVTDLIDVLTCDEDVGERAEDLSYLLRVLEDYSDKFSMFCGESGGKYVEPEREAQYAAGREFASLLRSSKPPMWNYPRRGPAQSYHYLGDKSVPRKAYKGLDDTDAQEMRGPLSDSKYKREINENFRLLVDPYGNTPFHTNEWKAQS